MSLPRVTYDDAADFLREAAWNFEDRYLWRGRRFLERRTDKASDVVDVAQEALERAQRSVEPLQRLIQTRVTWPLSDTLREKGTAARAGIATAATTAAIAAGTAGAMMGGGGGGHQGAVERAAEAPVTPPGPVAAATTQLQGVAPSFEHGEQGAQAAAATPPPVQPGAASQISNDPPARVAQRFAEAFVQYEVGNFKPVTGTVIASTATPELAEALRMNPPRLPANTKVPKARVLNVVLGEQKGKEVVASISLLRLEATSELRLTLREDKTGWRVSQVLG